VTVRLAFPKIFWEHNFEKGVFYFVVESAHFSIQQFHLNKYEIVEVAKLSRDELQLETTFRHHNRNCKSI